MDRQPSRTVVALLVLTLAVSACGGESGPVAADAFEPTRPGVLTVATDLPAPGFWERESGTFVGGFEWALATALADDLGLELEVREVDFADLVAGRVDGYDLALAEVTVTAARDEMVDFTEPYLDVDDALLVRTGTEVPDLATARDLSLGAVAGTTQESVLIESILPRSEPVLFNDLDAAIEALAGGGVDAIVLDTPIALAEAQLAQGAFEVPAQFATGGRFAGVVPEGSPNRDVLDALIRRAVNNGSLEEMRQTWLDPLLGRDPSTVPYLPLRTPRS